MYMLVLTTIYSNKTTTIKSRFNNKLFTPKFGDCLVPKMQRVKNKQTKTFNILLAYLESHIFFTISINGPLFTQLYNPL